MFVVSHHNYESERTFLKCKVDGNPCGIENKVDGNVSDVRCCLFELACEIFESYGLCSHESLITLNVDGVALIPVENE